MIEQLLPAGPLFRVRVRCSDRFDGDFHIDAPAHELEQHRAALAPGHWTWLRQVHGATVVTVGHPGAHAGVEGDATITSVPGAVLAAQTADCAPVVIASDGVVAVAHAGWRGIVDGVLPAAVAAIRAHTGGPVHALLGPVIRPDGYRFGEHELQEVEAVAGPTVRARTAAGEPALDMAAAVASVLADAGVEHFVDLKIDTAAPEYFSHRTRVDRGRQVTVAWLEPIASMEPENA